MFHRRFEVLCREGCNGHRMKAFGFVSTPNLSPISASSLIPSTALHKLNSSGSRREHGFVRRGPRAVNRRDAAPWEVNPQLGQLQRQATRNTEIFEHEGSPIESVVEWAACDPAKAAKGPANDAKIRMSGAWRDRKGYWRVWSGACRNTSLDCEMRSSAPWPNSPPRSHGRPANLLSTGICHKRNMPGP